MNCFAEPTVAFAFLVRSGIPFWHSVWEPYWSACGAGRIAVAVHAQHPDETLIEAVGKREGAHLLHNDSIVHGQLRFSAAMIKAELRLLGFAARQTAPNGCRVEYVQVVSESDAPIVPCHAFLASLKPGFTNIDLRPVHHPVAPKLLNELSDLALPTSAPYKLMKGTQWMTMYHSHAIALAADEHQIVTRMNDHTKQIRAMQGAVDAWVWPAVLAQRHLMMRSPGPTFYAFPHTTGHPDPNGHPVTFSSRASTLAACDDGFYQQRCFGRKFENNPDVVGALRDCISGTQQRSPERQLAALRASEALPFWSMTRNATSDDHLAALVRERTQSLHFECCTPALAQVPAPAPAPAPRAPELASYSHTSAAANALQNEGEGCWLKCSKEAGPCPSVCGLSGACCRSGFDAGLQECGFGANGCKRQHCCTAMATAPSAVPALPARSAPSRKGGGNK